MCVGAPEIHLLYVQTSCKLFVVIIYIFRYEIMRNCDLIGRRIKGFSPTMDVLRRSTYRKHRPYIDPDHNPCCCIDPEWHPDVGLRSDTWHYNACIQLRHRDTLLWALLRSCAVPAALITYSTVVTEGTTHKQRIYTT